MKSPEISVTLIYSINITVVIKTFEFIQNAELPVFFSEWNCLYSPQIRETMQSLRDSESGLESLAIGHHIGERAHIMERSQNRRTGDREERQDFINLDESESQMLGDYDEFVISNRILIFRKINRNREST